ncbi:hypothetical protein Hanom_Chr07g00633601 [Helianthus anomalus]
MVCVYKGCFYLKLFHLHSPIATKERKSLRSHLVLLVIFIYNSQIRFPGERKEVEGKGDGGGE